MLSLSSLRPTSFLPALLPALVAVLFLFTPLLAWSGAAKDHGHRRHAPQHADQQHGDIASAGKRRHTHRLRDQRPAQSITRGIGAHDTTVQHVTTYHAAITCPTGIHETDGDPQWCDTPFIQELSPPTSVHLEVIASPQHCSDMRFFIVWRNAAGDQSWLSHRLSPGESTLDRDLGNGVEKYLIFAIGHPGGCNHGTLESWSATVLQTTPRGRTPLP